MLSYVLIAVIILMIVSAMLILIIKPKNFPFYNIYGTRSTSGEYMKMQWVRLLDIFVLAPFALWLGHRLETDEFQPIAVPYLLYVYALLTFAYNFANFVRNAGW